MSDQDDKISEQQEEDQESAQDDAEERENMEREKKFGKDDKEGQKIKRTPTETPNKIRQKAKKKSSMKVSDMFGVLGLQYYLDHEALGIKKKKNESTSSGAEEYNFYMHEKKYSFGKDSLFILKESNQMRKYCVWLITWHWFDKVITLIIILNTISLVMQNYDFRIREDNSVSTLTYVRNQMEYFFTSVFMLEFVLKTLAMGLIFEQSTYLRDGWNVLDFAVVITSILSLIGSFNLSAIRTIRILRPLRSVKSVPGLRILVASLLDSMPNLGSVLVFLLYLLTLFGILGLQLFMGAYENRCRLTEYPINGYWPADPNITYLCGGDADCPQNEYCGNPIDYNLPNQDPQISDLSYGYTTFDNILWATFTIFQALTTEGWSTMVTQLIDAVNPILVYIYFIFLILIGTFFTVNLILAVINVQFLKNQSERKSELFKEEHYRKQQKRQKKMKERQAAAVHPTTNIADLVPSEDSDSEDEDAKKKKEDLIKRVLKPSKYEGRAELLKKLQDEFNKKVKRTNQQVNYFDPTHYTLEQIQVISGFEGGTQFRLIFFKIIDSVTFMIITNIIIIANTIVLAMDRYPQPSNEITILSYINLAFTIFFVIEMFFKILGLGIIGYFKDTMNVFDAILVALSLVDQVLNYAEVNVSGGSLTAVTAFRTFRIFRIFKLARNWKSFRDILIAIATTLEAIGFFTVLLLLFMVMSSLVGMELFAYYIPNERFNYNTFANAMISIFALLTQEAWNTITYYYMYEQGSWWPLIFFVSVEIVGNLILLKLFIAILIYNFGEKSIETEKKLQDKEKKIVFQDMINQFRSSLHLSDDGNTSGNKHKHHKIEKVYPEQHKKLKLNPNYTGQHQNSDIACFFLSKYDQARFEIRKENKQKKMIRRFYETAEMVNPDDISDDSSGDEQFKSQIQQKVQQALQSDLNSSGNSIAHSASQSVGISSSKKSGTQHDTSSGMDQIDSALMTGTSLFIFDNNSKFRKICYKLINKSYIIAMITIMILVSSVLLAIDDPLTPDDNVIVNEIDLIVTIFFTGEVLLKVLAYGLIFNGEYSYLRDISNILDFIVVIFSWVNMMVEADLSIFKILRVFRVLRPLRLVSRSDSLKIAINALIKAAPQFGNVIIVTCIFFLMFGILGTNLLKGTYYQCDITTVGNYTIQTNIDCYDYGGNWYNADYNFDNILNAMTGLFVISTTEGWLDQMNQGTDSVGINQQPIYNNNQIMSLYFISFIIVGAFFMMNVFAGVVLDAFNSETEKLKGYFQMKLEQQEWVDIRTRILDAKPAVNMISGNQWLSIKCFKLINHPYFDNIIFLMITINTAIFMTQYARQPTIMDELITYSNLFFLGIFSFELIVKLIALGKLYFVESFNRFDFVVMLFTIAGSILERLQLFTTFGTVISVFRSFRIVRIMRLVRSAKSLKMIFDTFFQTLTQLANIGGLLSIILFMYAILGINLFPFVKRTNGLSNKINFSSLGTALFTLFKCSTGESWDQVQADLMRQIQPNNVCLPESQLSDYYQYGFQGCGSVVGIIFMISFQLIFSMIMLNLFVAIIVQGYENIQKDEESIVSTTNIQRFIDTWKLFDQEGCGLIKALDLDRFLIKLSKPLGWKGLLLTQMAKRKIITQFRLPVFVKNNISMYSFYDVLETLGKDILLRKYGEDTELEPKKLVKANKDLVKKKIDLIKKLKDANTTAWTSEDINSCFVIMRRMRAFMENKKARKKESLDIRELPSEEQSDDNTPDHTQRPSSHALVTSHLMSVKG